MARKKSPSRRAVAFKAWMKFHGTNTTQVAERSEVKYQTLASFVQGDTQSLKGETEAKITKAYACTAAEIFGGEDSNVRVVPVIDFVSAGELVDRSAQLPAETETIEISGLEAGDYFGTRVDGDSMDRLSPPGALIIVNRAEREPVRGKRYVFSHRGRTTYKRYEVDPIRLEPESLNPANKAIFPKDGETWDVVGRVRLTIAEV